MIGAKRHFKIYFKQCIKKMTSTNHELQSRGDYEGQNSDKQKNRNNNILQHSWKVFKNMHFAYFITRFPN